MNSDIRIAIVGDLEAERLSHRATNEALLHGADALHLTVSADFEETAPASACPRFSGCRRGFSDAEKERS